MAYTQKLAIAKMLERNCALAYFERRAEECPPLPRPIRLTRTSNLTPRYEKDCPTCKERFLAKVARAKYCSKRCRVLANVRLHRNRKANNPDKYHYMRAQRTLAWVQWKYGEKKACPRLPGRPTREQQRLLAEEDISKGKWWVDRNVWQLRKSKRERNLRAATRLREKRGKKLNIVRHED